MMGLVLILAGSSAQVKASTVECILQCSYKASYPLTKPDDTTQRLSADMEHSIREGMREILPQFVDRKFTDTKFCWYVHNDQYESKGHLLTNPQA